MEAMAIDLRHRRRRLAVMAVLLREPRRLVLAARLPLLGERWLVIPLTLGRWAELS